MVTWQRRSSLRNSRVMGITALGGGPLSFLLAPFSGPPAVPARSLALSWAVWSGAMPNFALKGFSEDRLLTAGFSGRDPHRMMHVYGLCVRDPSA